ncbi:GNAT family N-acetyltransferase [Arhodomonas sp. AD133]|uniref:GNAT family N-acetyltransferase n=1 Tax=Arhodomonas sp. AD133 TaxID=3415009 RepID=UPI003EBEBB4C
MEETGTGVRIRPLTTVDAASFKALRLAGLRECPVAFGSSYEEERDGTLANVSERIGPTATSAVFGAFDSSELVGVLGVSRHTARKWWHKASLWGMYVMPAHRANGVARALLNRGIRFAASMAGVRWLTLSVAVTNAAAQALYESVGFRCYGREPEALCVGGVYHDERLMALPLTRRAGPNTH